MTAKYEEMINNILFVHKFSELAEVKIVDDDLVILLSKLLNNAMTLLILLRISTGQNMCLNQCLCMMWVI